MDGTQRYSFLLVRLFAMPSTEVSIKVMVWSYVTSDRVEVQVRATSLWQ